MLLAVETALDKLSDAEKQGTPRGQLLKQFKNMTDFASGRWYLSPEQQIGLRVYRAIIGELTNLPDGQEGGSPNLLASFIADETAMLRRQRVALSESQPSLARAQVLDW